MIDDARADRTELRLRLYQNGFTPLPNFHKMCLLKEWSTVTVTPELIGSREWARSNRDRDTGIRCGDVIAIDWDINDADLLNRLLDEIVAAGVIEESTFVRIGKPPREMWLYRTSDKIGKRTTGFFRRPGADEDVKAEQVEVLGAGCQFAAYGMRDDETPYTWPADSLLDFQYRDLPEITLAQVEAVKTFASEFFERHGLERKSAAGGTDEGYTHVYDLTDDMVFDVHEHGPMTVAAIRDYLTADPGKVLRCRVDTLRPGTSGSLAGMVSLVDGSVCVSDHGSYTSHFPKEQDVEGSFAALGELLREKFPQVVHTPPLPPVELDPGELTLKTSDELNDNLQRALQRFVYLSETNTIADVLENNVTITADHFRNFTAPYYEARISARGTQTMAYLSKLWLEHKDRRNARRAHMRPDQAIPLYTEGDSMFVNTYRPLVLPTGGDASVGFDLLRQLLPSPFEYQYFLQWLSYKVQFPDTRGPAVVMVAHDRYGTGRGSLVELIKSLFSRGLVRTIDFQTLTGNGTQGQYNEWLADALVVAINEAQETSGHMSKWREKSNAYEHLKTIVDPGSHDVYVKRKGMSNYAGRTSASVLVMTNHMDSLIIPPGDRRFAVLANGTPPDQQFWREFHEWRRYPINLGAFVEQLREVSLAGYNPYEAPPMTQSKRDMIDAGMSPLDRAVEAVFERMPGKLLTREQLNNMLELYLTEVSVEFPDGWARMVDRIFTRRTHTIEHNDKLLIEGKMRIVRRLDGATPAMLSSEDAMLAEVLKNGPIGRQFGSSESPENSGSRSNVVSFTSRKAL